MKHGYTLVELMILVAIVGILVSFGVSAYGKARDRQAGQAAVEEVLSLLQENQTIASIGKIDCTNKFLGQEVTIIPPNSFKQQSMCENDPGVATTTTFSGIAGLSSATLTFNPLSLGITLPTNPYLLNIVAGNGTTYQIELTSSGTIEYQGMQ
jgi:prepilin-type N-terminal cleavage/methylation domain-containing protein